MKPCIGGFDGLRRIPTTNPAAARHNTRKAGAKMLFSFIIDLHKSSVRTTADVTFPKGKSAATSDQARADFVIAAVVPHEQTVRKLAARRAAGELSPLTAVIENVPKPAFAIWITALRKGDVIE